MTYKIFYTKSAYKDIQKLDRVVKKRVKKAIEKNIIASLDIARQLTDPGIGDYRWRLGNYRIIFDIHEKTVVVLRVRHRRES